MIRKLFFIYSLILFSNVTLAELSPSDFAKNSDYFLVKISPDGKHLAVGIKGGQEQRLAILDTKTFKTVGTASLAGRYEVGEFFWVNNERIVVKMVKTRGTHDGLWYTGELFAVDVDGDNPTIIYGYQAGGSETSTLMRRKKAIYGTATILHLLPDDDDHILISSKPWKEKGDKNERKSSVFRLNVNNGRMYDVEKLIPLVNPEYILDKSGNIRFISGINKNFSRVARQLDQDTGDWSEISSIKINSGFDLVTLNDAGDKLYFFNDNDEGMQGLYRMKLANGEIKEIYTPENVDITQVISTADKSSSYAIRVDEYYPEYLIFDKKHRDAEVFKSLLATFPGSEVEITSNSDDGMQWVLKVSTDTSSGSYYLYDIKEQKILFLFAQLADIPEKQLAKSEAIELKARDGQTLRGFLTVPNKGKENYPLVTLVHGGPRLRDYWGYNGEVQMLANEGYAVLQINYRGSSGYGTDFMKAGNFKWGSKVQEDIIDATRWAMAQKGIDKEKACIMGASFGGYSAVQSSILAPDLFSCAVANVGIYDLEMLYDEGDIQEYYYGKSYLKFVIGEDKEQLRAYSPVHHAGRLKAPILIAHGGKDERAPLEHAEALKEAMDETNKAYEWFVKPKEGHGFDNPENRAEYYETVAKFLAKHLK